MDDGTISSSYSNLMTIKALRTDRMKCIIIITSSNGHLFLHAPCWWKILWLILYSDILCVDTIKNFWYWRTILISTIWINFFLIPAFYENQWKLYFISNITVYVIQNKLSFFGINNSLFHFYICMFNIFLKEILKAEVHITMHLWRFNCNIIAILHVYLRFDLTVLKHKDQKKCTN